MDIYDQLLGRDYGQSLAENEFQVQKCGIKC